MHLTINRRIHQKKVLQYIAKFTSTVYFVNINDSVSLMINLMINLIINGNYLFITLIKRFLVLYRWTTI